jgi:hypothetical protein
MYHRIDSRRERDCHAHRDDLRGTHCFTNFHADLIMRAVIHTVCGRCGRGSLLNGMIRAGEDRKPSAWWYNTAFEYYNVNSVYRFRRSNGYSSHVLSRETVSECSV